MEEDFLSAPSELEERGGLQKLKDAKAERAEQARLDRESYKSWFQVASWFDEDEGEGGASKPIAPEGAGYAEIKAWLDKGQGTDKLLRHGADGTDCDRLRHRADHFFYLGKYEESASCYLRVLGTYKVLGTLRSR
jgi:hypothetical protein